MKTFTILSLAAALTGIASADTPAATIAPAASVPADAPAAQTPSAKPTSAKPGATGEEAETLLKEMMTSLGDLSKVLETVTDKASADAAAPKVIELSAKVKELQLRSEKMGEPSQEVQQSLMEQYSKQLEETVGKFMQASMKVGMANFYGSESLTKAFQNMSAAMSAVPSDSDEADEEVDDAPASETPAAPAPESK